MAASIPIEEESGTFTRRLHRHNGYYAGDFSTPRPTPRTDALPRAAAATYGHDRRMEEQA